MLQRVCVVIEQKLRICIRCKNEGNRRRTKLYKGMTFAKASEENKWKPMKFSMPNTLLKFREHLEQALYNLTLVEESMIAKVSAVMSIGKTAGMWCAHLLQECACLTCVGGQSKSSGQCYFFVQWDGLKNVASKLPRRVTECRVYFVHEDKNGNVVKRIVSYKVNPARILEALHYLIAHNWLYKNNTQIDEAVLQEIRDIHRQYDADGNELPNTLDAIFTENAVEDEDERVRYSAILQESGEFRDVIASINDQYGVGKGRRIPETTIDRTGEPVYASKFDHLGAHIFPSLFPDGLGSNYKHFQVPMTTAQYLKHTMAFADRRFAGHYRYLFVMQNIKSMEAANSSVSAVMNGRIVGKDMSSINKSSWKGFLQSMHEKGKVRLCENMPGQLRRT